MASLFAKLLARPCRDACVAIENGDLLSELWADRQGGSTKYAAVVYECGW